MITEKWANFVRETIKEYSAQEDTVILVDSPTLIQARLLASIFDPAQGEGKNSVESEQTDRVEGSVQPEGEKQQESPLRLRMWADPFDVALMGGTTLPFEFKLDRFCRRVWDQPGMTFHVFTIPIPTLPNSQHNTQPDH